MFQSKKQGHLQNRSDGGGDSESEDFDGAGPSTSSGLGGASSSAFVSAFERASSSSRARKLNNRVGEILRDAVQKQEARQAAAASGDHGSGFGCSGSLSGLGQSSSGGGNFGSDPATTASNVVAAAAAAAAANISMLSPASAAAISAMRLSSSGGSGASGGSGLGGAGTDDDGSDPNEPRYCICNQVSYGEMVACDNKGCPFEWLHYSCVGITQPPKGKWYCPQCTAAMRRRASRLAAASQQGF